MKLILLTVLITVSSLVAKAQLTQHSITVPGQPSIGFYDFKPADYTTDASKKFPLIIALHGAGERGNGTTDINKVFTSGIGYQIKTNHATMQFNYPNNVKGSFVVLLPQLDGQFAAWQPFYIDEMVKWGKANLNIDPNRIIITGYSLGGGGTWVYPSYSLANATNIAGLLPVSGSGLPKTYVHDLCNIAQGGVAVWAIHTDDDNQVLDTFTSRIIDTIKGCTPAPLAPVASWYPDGNHQIYDQKIFNDTANRYSYPTVYQWMLRVTRDNLTRPNEAPIANVGATDTTVVVTSSYYFTKTLTAALSEDPNDIIVHYDWGLVSTAMGPNIWPAGGFQAVNFTNNSWPAKNLDIRNLSWPVQNFEFHKLGDYTFKLTVTDMYGATSTQNKTIHLTDNGQNTAPFLEIGSDVVLRSSTVAPGDTAFNFNAKVFDWQTPSNNLTYSVVKESGPVNGRVTIDNANWFAGKFRGFTVPGTYTFKITATDGGGLQSVDRMSITKLADALPVTYLYFNGKNNDGNNVLSWATSAEINNDHFDVLKSSDGKDFEVLATVPASTEAGETKKYIYTDTNPYDGVNYYRLAQYDIDGTKKLSDIITVRNIQGASVVTYPNPIHNLLNVAVKGDIKGVIKIKILDASGRVVRQLEASKNAATLTKTIELGDLQSGVYLLELSQENGWRKIQRFVK